jgi:hypothetical protein
MTHNNLPLLQPFADALGDEALTSLAERELIRSIRLPDFKPVDPAVTADRIDGAVAGLNTRRCVRCSLPAFA